MMTVWVLSEESPFDEPEASGGCICGVFASPAAALLELGTWDIGPEALADITWVRWSVNTYEGRGYGDAVYILRRHVVQDEQHIRETLVAEAQRHAMQPHFSTAWTTEDLLAMLPGEPPEDLPS